MKLLYPKNIPLSDVKRFIVIFYAVGILGLVPEITRSLFIALIPFALLVNTYLLLLFHSNFNRSSIAAFILIALSGFFVEVAGVNTGLIFGHYSYGSGLGFKLLDTPLIIGLNWLFLTYTGLTIAEKIAKNRVAQVFLAPTVMLIFDIVLEQAAPIMDMWSWRGDAVPLKNYIAWWIIGFIFSLVAKVFKVSMSNPLGVLLFLCQLLFFGVFLLFIKVIL